MSNSGLLDTNVVVHSLANDSHTEECKRFLAEVAAGRIRVRIEPIIVHELTFAIGHYKKNLTRVEIGLIVRSVLALKGVEGNMDLLSEAVGQWAKTPGLGFADAYLALLAIDEDRPVYTKNIRELRDQGATVPDPLPH